MDAEDERDGDLLRAYARGDRQAFGRLYDRYDPACYRFIRRQLGRAHAEAAEDIHQETWIAVSRNAPRFDPRRASFAAWLFTIARHKTFDHFRRQKIAVLNSAGDAGLDDVAMRAADPALNPLEQVQSREQAERIIAAVEALPLEQRSAFVMFADAGLSLEEIAHVTGVPLETAKSRLRYARAKLREMLAQERSAHA